MNEVLQAALEIQQFCESRRWRFCFIGGLAVRKCVVNRDHDWFDVESILERQSGSLDRKLIGHELGPLAELKSEDDIMGHWLRLSRRCRGRPPGPRNKKR